MDNSKFENIESNIMSLLNKKKIIKGTRSVRLEKPSNIKKEKAQYLKDMKAMKSVVRKRFCNEKLKLIE
jgi:hypothetical protein